MPSHRARTKLRRSAGVRPFITEWLEGRLLLSATPAAGQDPSLTAWFTASSISAPSGTPISSWTDSSGNGFTATQTNPAQDPIYLTDAINAKPVLHFDSSASTGLAFPRPVGGDFTLMVVFRSTQGLGMGQEWYNGAGLIDGEVTGLANDFGLSLNSYGQVLSGTGNPDTFADSAMGFNDGRPHVATFERVQSTGAVSMYVDGKLFATATGSTGTLSSSGRLTIGSIQTDKNYFSGDIADVRVYSTALPAASRTSAESSLEGTYDIAPATSTAYFTNPVIDSNFPDPAVLRASGQYYAYATNGNGSNAQTERSTDLVHWTRLGDSLPTLPTWAQPGRTWAPNVDQLANGTFAMYFTAWDAASGRQALGVATASTPNGPFIARGNAPLVDESNIGGAIDSSVFTASNGTRYLLWKNDGNAIGQTTYIWIQQLSADGLSLVGSPTQLIHNDQSWEGSVIEAPYLWQHNGQYFLFYSANNYADGSYETGYAVSSSLLGGYTKPTNGPWLASSNGVVGPGGASLFTGPDGNTWMVYHSWRNNLAYRAMSIDEIVWNGNVPTLRGPSLYAQAVPTVPAVVGRYVFYNSSYYDGNDPTANGLDANAIATDKTALLPGQKATFANYTSYTRGINGIMVDVSNLPVGAMLSPGDFQLRVGNSSTPSTWASAAIATTVTVLPGGGVNGSDRIEVTWADGTISKEWLQVTVLADANTALASPDVFYFGNAVAESGNSTTNAVVDANDEIGARNNQTGAFNPPAITNIYDYNRNHVVDTGDQLAARNNQTGAFNQLKLIDLTTTPAVQLATTTGSARGVPPSGSAKAKGFPAALIPLQAWLAGTINPLTLPSQWAAASSTRSAWLASAATKPWLL